jgi:hypothetical protein
LLPLSKLCLEGLDHRWHWRGFWVFFLLFWAFNLFMAAWVITYWSFLNRPELTDDAARTGVLIGGTIGTGLIVFFWVAGAVILGLFALLTRGRKTIITEDWE